MSVNTEATEHIEKAKEDVQSAIMHLGKIVIDQCWGADDFIHPYKVIIANCLNELIVIRGQL